MRALTMGKLRFQASSYRRDRTLGRGGGVVVYVSDSIKGSRRFDLEVKLFLLGNVYRPPNETDKWMETLSVMLERVVQEGKEVILMGDFNCNMLSTKDSKANRITMIASEYDLQQ